MAIDSLSTERIAMLIPYFGKWPEWMPLYLYTCSRNPQIDFHYFTDCGEPEVTYPNTFFHSTSFDEYLVLVEQVVGVRLPKIASKLCDVKPFYGLMHSDLLAEGKYTWWGFGDIDVAYGDLTPLTRLTSRKQLELITTHIKCVSGHFTLIRTDSSLNRIMFPLESSLKEIIEAEPPGWVDERQYSETVRPRGMRIIDCLWYSFGRKTGINRNRLYHTVGRLLPNGTGRQYYCEPGTTFTPYPREKYILDLKTLRWQMGNGEFPENILPEETLPYLHFLMFKKISYNHTGNFWTPGFYRIPAGYQWRGDECVEFTTSHIRLK
ncbi:MAG: hypothetical protein NC193_07130 [bacterium]|nr:hypothetical protein [bacterium]